MIHVPKFYAHPGPLEIPITVDEEVLGVQFDLLYQAASVYESIQIPPGAFGGANVISAGRLRVVFTTPDIILPNPVCTITLNIAGSTGLVIVDARASVYDQGQVISIPLVSDDGEVVVGEPMNIELEWVDNNSPQAEVIDASVYKSDQDDPAVGTWELVGTAPVGTNVLQSPLEIDQGTVYFMAKPRNIIDEGPASNVAELNTDVPIALESLTVRII